MRIALHGLLVLTLGFAAGCGGSSSSSSGLTYAQVGANKPAPKAAAAPPAEAPKPKSVAEVCSGVEVVPVATALLAPGLSSVQEKGDDRGASSVAARGAKGEYTMADLQALKARKSWSELLAHIEDVAPAGRTPAWDQLLVEGATGYLASLSTKSHSDVFHGFWTAEDLAKRYPPLQKARDFMAKRGEIGKSALTECFVGSYSGAPCVDRAKAFIALGENDRALDLAVGKVVRLNQNHYNAVPFFRAAVAGTTDDAACTDEDLKLALMAGLGLPGHYENAKGAREIGVACFNKVHADLDNELLSSGAGGYTRVNICSVLKAKGAVQ